MKNVSPTLLGESPAYLMAAAYSARKSGDRELERTARKRLTDQFGIRLTFGKPNRLNVADNGQGGDS